MSPINFTKLAAVLATCASLTRAQDSAERFSCSLPSGFDRTVTENELYDAKQIGMFDFNPSPGPVKHAIRGSYECESYVTEYSFIPGCTTKSELYPFGTDEGLFLGPGEFRGTIRQIIIEGGLTYNISIFGYGNVQATLVPKSLEVVERSPQCYGGYCPPASSVEESTIYVPPFEPSTVYIPPSEASTTVYGPPQETSTITSTTLITVGCSAPGYGTDAGCPTSALPTETDEESSTGTASVTGTEFSGTASATGTASSGTVSSTGTASSGTVSSTGTASSGTASTTVTATTTVVNNLIPFEPLTIPTETIAIPSSQGSSVESCRGPLGAMVMVMAGFLLLA
ncbi:hypothetical protein EJ05DRAFT_485734 [Pseudovirgaria hyperparasitica]|uniref:GPI anchored cell wall protein n=1 Tax=Pseudovirgaria hyperparasitica TaxID=470096 RepID=A0A6A6W701_9PEZI|nr:uncharacterized protein EJ05DRAFT_485734 [Pseudovirgaria hyperparasitica]KAF2758632.1 hypothetical protein EJ05DRAFT_485734 [Pseudovirgaria hyperparasitica]